MNKRSTSLHKRLVFFLWKMSTLQSLVYKGKVLIAHRRDMTPPYVKWGMGDLRRIQKRWSNENISILM